MSFPDLDNYQQSDSNLPGKLKALLPELGRYLETQLTPKRAAQSERQKDIVPVTLAKKLKIDESLALALLMIYENAGVVTPVYHVLCPESDAVLGAFTSPKELPATVSCAYHDPEKTHDKSDYYVDLVFRFTPKAMENYLRPTKS